MQPTSALTRRTLLGLGLALPVNAVLAQGARVWLDMDQKQLDDAYDQSVYAPNQRQVTGRYATNSARTRAKLGAPRRYAYGAAEIEQLDVFTARRANAPINVFIHGGAWRSGRSESYAFPAELFVNAGAHYVVPDFNAVQEVGGSLLPMADQVRRALVWVYRNARSFDGDPERIYLSGFSSGAHLAACALTMDLDFIKGALCCSGMYDLKPVRLSARSSYVKFTDEMEQALSPQRHLERLRAPLVVAHGTLETPEFQRQAREFAAAVKAAGKPVKLVVGEGYNHFEMFETLASPYGVLGEAVLEQMKF